MVQLARWRVIVVALVTVIGIALALPNFLPQSVRAALPGFLPKETINLGLDLRGGSHLLLEVDVAALRRAHLDDIADQMGAALRDATPAIQRTGRGVVGDAARIRVINAEDMERARAALRPLAVSATSADPILTFSEAEGGVIEARLTETYVRELARGAAQQSVEVIRRRIDPTGTSEVSIARQGDDRVVVQAPGLSDPEQLKQRILAAKNGS